MVYSATLLNSSTSCPKVSLGILCHPIKDSHQSLRRRARFRSLQRKGAAWIDSIPFLSQVALKLGDFCLVACLSLGCDILMSSVIEGCRRECKKINDTDGYDLLTCKTGGGPIWSHESLAST